MYIIHNVYNYNMILFDGEKIRKEMKIYETNNFLQILNIGDILLKLNIYNYDINAMTKNMTLIIA